MSFSALMHRISVDLPEPEGPMMQILALHDVHVYTFQDLKRSKGLANVA